MALGTSIDKPQPSAWFKSLWQAAGFLRSRAKCGYRAARSQAVPPQPISKCVEKSSNKNVVTGLPCAVGGWASMMTGGAKRTGSVQYFYGKERY